MITRRTDRRGPLAALLAIAVGGTLARLLALDARIAHWGEARLGYDVLRYAATGVYEYRPVTHGPLLYHVDRVLFEFVGASDFAARLPVAVVGGLLPLAAWLYRDHLRDLELVALGALLSASPVLVYYSRFLGNDVLVAAFAFTALGFLLRTRTTGDARYLYAASTVGALAFASKANALLYALLWIAAGLVVLDQRAFVRAVAGRPIFDHERGAALVAKARASGTPEMAVVALFNPVFVLAFGPFSTVVVAILVAVVALLAGLVLQDHGRIVDRNAVWLIGGVVAAYVAASGFLGDPLASGGRQVAFALTWLAAAAGIVGVLASGTPTGARIRRWRGPATLAVAWFLVLTLVLFAPRNPDGLGLWSSLTAPSTLPALVEAGLITPLSEYGRVWLSSNGNDALSFAVPLLLTLAFAAVTVTVAGTIGFLANRYGDRDEVVEFALVWAGLSVLVYPIAALVNAPWHAVHVVVPLAVPAAVAVAAVARRLFAGVRDADPAVAGVAVLVLCVAFGAPLAAAAGTSYLHPQSQDNPLVQYGQPSDDFRETLAAIDAGAAANDDGPDVVYYGEYFHVENPERADRLPVGDVYVQNDGGEYEIVEENEGWYNRLPLPWYTESFGATTASADTRAGLDDLAATDPPVVVVRSQLAENVSTVLGGGYRRTTFNLTQHNVTVTVFLDDTATPPRASLAGSPAATGSIVPFDSKISRSPTTHVEGEPASTVARNSRRKR
ncbi:flippase activity-associated protein Agl23 [Halorubellus sp. JP-L1]|uniref:flippase activity-associated protein Agl23 n=1 Tax=Halorubellus sp. JP-L1 TaxID=2715753 RepID=UPI001878CD3C|nr:flippase activity-associated protein Agl23 [Halorubellus sp. JP-L1]